LSIQVVITADNHIDPSVTKYGSKQKDRKRDFIESFRAITDFALALNPETKESYPNFLFLDEPLASSDTDRRENIVNLINTNLTNRFKQIILISHISESEFDLIVDNVIRMENGRMLR
jgi:ABC-type dipeptide/oligopeptide/nickel transport system ATPase subunit